MTALDDFAAYIQRELGINADLLPAPFLRNVLQRRSSGLGLSSVEYVARLRGATGRTELETVASAVTVTESYFFRHREQLLAFLDFIRGRGSLRILSAGCAAGEEIYSLAILLREAGLDATLVAFDVNAEALARAREGKYTAWSLRDTDTATRSRWFSPEGERYRLHREVRESVTFHWGNLLDPRLPFWGDSWDVIFCRNVLMYFPPAITRQLVSRMTGALRPDGALFLGHAETLRGLSDRFELCQRGLAFYYRLLPPDRPAPSVRPAQRAAASRQNRLDRHEQERPCAAPEPDSPPALDELLRAENYVAALQALPATDEESTAAARCLLLALCGRWDEAEQASRELQKRCPTSPAAFYTAGLCSEARGDSGQALDFYERAASLGPTLSMPHVHIGMLSETLGQEQASRRAFARASLLLVDEPDASLLLYAGGFSRSALQRFCGARSGR